MKKKAPNTTPATLADYAAFLRIETKAEAEAAEAIKAAKADPTDPAKAEAAKQATKAAKEAAKAAPRRAYIIAAESIKEAHEAAEAKAAKLKKRIANIKVCICYTDQSGNIDPAALEAAARQIAKRTAANAVQREGTPTQIKIDNAARARDFDFYDLAEMVSEAKNALYICANMPPADLLAIAAAFTTAAADLAKISAYDRAAALAIESRTAAALAEVSKMTATEATADPHTAKRAAAFYTLCAEAAAKRTTDRAAFTEAATRAAYIKLNHFLLSLRAIHTDEAPAPLALDDLDPDKIADPRTYDPEAITEAEADRRALLKAAFRKVFDTLTPRAAQVFKLLYKGATAAQISRKLNIDESTTREHIANITETTAAALATLAPEASETTAAKLAAFTANIEAAKAAATLAAKRKAAAAKKAKAAAADKLTKAADRAAAIAEAIAEAADKLTPTARRVYQCFESGKGRNETARILTKGLATISEHKANITRQIAEAVKKAAPDLDPEAIDAADLADLLRLAK